MCLYLCLDLDLDLDLYLCSCLWSFNLRHHSIFIILNLCFDLITLLFAVLKLKLIHPFIQVSFLKKYCLLCAFVVLLTDRNMRELVDIYYFKADSASSALAFRIFTSFNRYFCIFISTIHNLIVILYILIRMLIQPSYFCFSNAKIEILFHLLLLTTVLILNFPYLYQKNWSCLESIWVKCSF